MSPMPIGASIAMLLSLFVALTITPYLGYLFLREKDKSEDEKVNSDEVAAMQHNFIYKMYEKFEKPLLENRSKRWMFLGVTILLLLGSLSLFFTKSVAVKMLPFDNKNELIYKHALQKFNHQKIIQDYLNFIENYSLKK